MIVVNFIKCSHLAGHLQLKKNRKKMPGMPRNLFNVKNSDVLFMSH